MVSNYGADTKNVMKNRRIDRPGKDNVSRAHRGETWSQIDI